MWVTGQSRGEWSFMAFCAKPGFINDDPCDQPITRNTQVIHCCLPIPQRLKQPKYHQAGKINLCQHFTAWHSLPCSLNRAVERMAPYVR